MDFTKPLLSGRAAAIVASVGGLLAMSAAFIPAPWGTLAAIVGFLLSGLAGLAGAAPRVTEGKPILQGGALVAGTTLLGVLVEFFGALPHGWPQGIALSVAALLAWLTGKALPPLGAPSPATVQALQDGAAAAAVIDSKAEAIRSLERGPQP